MNIGMLSRFNRFETICNQPLDKYFGLQHNYDKFDILPTRTNDKIELLIRVEKKYYYDFGSLPTDMSRVISEYLSKFIYICVEITFPYDYPFKPPKYALLYTKHNLNVPINLENYYKGIVINHNLQYKRDWSPAIEIVKDILDFIRKINHFEYLF
jgi:hypothetical protein